ncbi:hypothetical protein [Dyella sp.]|uniref:hypothetical protein n=1 Tax=Dyella sp. TaxID=1869338 RepID=UPI003F7DC710
MKGYLIAAAIALLAGALWLSHHLGYSAGYTAGTNAVQAADAKGAHQADATTDQHQTAAANAGNALQTQIQLTIPAIEVHTDDSKRRIRTLYLAQPAAAAAECRRPDSVQAELDTAVDRANAAARGDLRPHPAAQDTAQGAMAAQRGGSG